MYYKINNLLEQYLGVRVVHTGKSRVLSQVKKPGKGNLIVEFIGASCSGKTTLCDYYLKKHRHKFDKTVFDKYQLAKLNKSRIKIKGRHTRFLNEKIKYLGNQKRFTGVSKLRKINKIYDYLIEDYIVSNYMAESLIIVDEHLSSRLYNEVPEKDKDLEEFYKNRLVVYCSISPDTHIKRIKKRRERRFKPSLYKDYEGQNLINASTRQLKKKKELANELKKKGVRVIEIDTANNLDQNSRLIDDFIRKTI